MPITLQMSQYNIKYNFKARLNVACNITEKTCFSWNKIKKPSQNKTEATNISPYINFHDDPESPIKHSEILSLKGIFTITIVLACKCSSYNHLKTKVYQALLQLLKSAL